MIRVSLFAPLFGSLVCLCLASCAGDLGRTGPADAAPDDSGGQISSGLPALSRLHEVSKIVETHVLGKDAALQSDGAVAVGSGLQLDASGSGAALQWGVYAWNISDGTPYHVSIELSPAEDSPAWIGVANFGTGR